MLQHEGLYSEATVRVDAGGNFCPEGQDTRGDNDPARTRALRGRRGRVTGG